MPLRMEHRMFHRCIQLEVMRINARNRTSKKAFHSPKLMSNVSKIKSFNEVNAKLHDFYSARGSGGS
jgi:hypothetical protein